MLFLNIVFACIMIAGVVVGIQSYPSMSDNSVLAMIEFIIMVSKGERAGVNSCIRP